MAGVIPAMHTAMRRETLSQKNQGRIRGCSPNSAIHLPKGSDRSTQRATCSTLAPSFIGACATSLRHAPRATAAMTAARTIAPFIGISVVSCEPDCLTRYLTSNRNVCAELHGHGFLTAASRQRNSGHEGRDHEYVLDVHVFSPSEHRTVLATDAQRSDQGRNSLSKGFPRRLVRNCNFS
jgi:hypothetical protein